MSRVPLRPGEGQRPDDQISVPVPRGIKGYHRDGKLRQPLKQSVVESYRTNIFRIWHDGLERPSVDLVPDENATNVPPSALLGEDVEVAYLMSGVNPYGRLSTREENGNALFHFRYMLDFHRWNWLPMTATSPEREWVEGGALLHGEDEETVAFLGHRHGQSVFFRWDAEGLTPVPVYTNVDVGDGRPVPVRLEQSLTGCPMRKGVDDVCKMDGGPWTSNSITVARLWQDHRSMLIDAFGCDVCKAEGGKGARAAVGLFAPSREGGWQWALPMTLVEMGEQ